ncbi:MAG: hypothetical protein HYR67_02555 [Bacteroidetes bacterium]|nr:hypothetical protein [Bacteroidota bacterium]
MPVLVTTAYGLFIYKRLIEELKIFSWFLFLSGFIQLVSSLLWFNRQNNLPLLHLYVAAGFVCLAWFYASVLKDFVNQKIIWGAAILFTLFTVINSLFVQNILTFNSYALTTESVLIIILSLFTFIVLLNDIVKEKRMPLIKSLNWINSGLFIYYTSSLLIFYFGDLFTRKFPVYLNQYTWVLHAFFSLVMYSCFFVGLWKRPRN